MMTDSARQTPLLKAIARGPQTEARILDEKNIFSADAVPALAKLKRIVQLQHVVQLGVTEARAFDLFAG